MMFTIMALTTSVPAIQKLLDEKIFTSDFNHIEGLA